MSDMKNDQSMINESVDKAADAAAVTDPFASLNKMLEENPQFKNIYDSIVNILSDDTPDEGETEVDCFEIDGHNYFEIKRIEIVGNTYLLLLNEDDYMDFVIQKVTIEDGEEYATDLDSEKEFDLVLAHIQRDALMQIKEKQKGDREDKPEDQ